MDENSNKVFEEYLEMLFDKSEGAEKTKEKLLNMLKNSQENIVKEKVFQKNILKENTLKILKILQENILKENILKILKKWSPSNETFVFISKQNDEEKICNISQKNLFLMTKTFKDFLFEIKIINQKENDDIEEQIKFFSNKYQKCNQDLIVETTKESYTGGLNVTIELKKLDQHWKKLSEKIYSTNHTFEKEQNKMEDLYIEYVLLQRAIFFLKVKYKKESELWRYYSNLFIFLRHANNNLFPSLLMFDASFEKLLESEEE